MPINDLCAKPRILQGLVEAGKTTISEIVSTSTNSTLVILFVLPGLPTWLIRFKALPKVVKRSGTDGNSSVRLVRRRIMMKTPVSKM